MSSFPAFSTSHLQQANWFLYKLDPAGLSDKLSLAVRIRSPLDVPTVRSALQALGEDRPLLRSIYYEQEGKIVREIRERAEISLETVDASSWSDSTIDSQLMEWAKFPFNLEISGFRAFLLSLSLAEHILLLTVHQVVGNWESLLILLDDLVRIYESHTEGDCRVIPGVNASYRDYVREEIEFLNSAKGKEAADYWQHKLAAELPVLELPTSASRPPIRTYNGAAVRFTIAAPLTQQVKQLAKAQAVTPEELLLAAFKVLLYRYTGEEDILVGLLHPKNRPSVRRVVGNLTNVVVSRDKVSGKLRFSEFLTRVSKTVFEIGNYNDYPFALLVKQIELSNLNYPPICQTAFGYSKMENLCQAKGLEIELYELPQQKVDFDLSLEMIELQESLSGYFKYNSDILDATTVTRIAEHFQNLLAAIVASPETSVDKLPMLSERERQQILVEWNNTKADYPQDRYIHNLFENQVEKTPDAVAVVLEEQKLTYSQLNERANELARYLQQLGVQPQVRVGICVERSLEMMVGLLAILKAGGAYVPLDPSYPSQRLAYMLDDAMVSVLLTQESLLSLLPEHQAQVVCLDRDWEAIASFSPAELTDTVRPENLAYIIYTSGSTGQPKGVAMSQRALVNLIMWQQQESAIATGERTLQFAPISFDVSFQEIFSTWCAGGTLVLVNEQIRRDPLALWQFMLKEQVERLFLPFVALQQLAVVASRCQSLPQLREIITAGEQLQMSRDLIEMMNRLPNCRVQNQYGPSESHVVSAYTLQGSAANWPSLPPIGRPIANTQLYILTPDLQPVPIGVPGELYIGGVAVANGYLNRPQLTAEKFIPDPFSDRPPNRLYKTGDLARYLPDGNIEFLGRRDHQVKIRGFRIEIGEIEATLARHPIVKETVVVAREDNPGNKRLVAYIVLETAIASDAEPTEERELVAQLKQDLKAQLAEYMVPSAFEVLPQLPLTPSGKVNRRGLPAPKLAHLSTSENFVAPRDRLEEQLVEIWSDILNLAPVGIKDSFFELGGHSLLAVNLMAKIQGCFGRQLPLSTLFTNPTIEDLAQLLREQKQVGSSSLVPLQTRGTKRPFFCVHPAGGHVFYYRDLSRYLGSDRPFYGLQAQGFNRGETVFTRVEDMARFYLETIREVQPEGALQIGGWSFGGVVAFEMARQLLEQGEEVGLLAMLDPWVPVLLDPNKQIDNLYLKGVLSRYFGGIFGVGDLVREEELSGLSSQEQIEFILSKAEKLGLFPQEASREQNRRFLDVIIGTLKATYTYKRRPYPGKVTVFRAREKHPHACDPQLVWVELYAILDAADVEVVMVPGDHFTFLKEPNLGVLAERLNSYLR